MALRKQRSDANVVRAKRYQKLPISNRHPWRCRCSRTSCLARRTLAKHPSLYVVPPTCHCGALLRPDFYRQLTETTKQKCECGFASFPHRRGYCAKVRE